MGRLVVLLLNLNNFFCIQERCLAFGDCELYIYIYISLSLSLFVGSPKFLLL